MLNNTWDSISVFFFAVLLMSPICFWTAYFAFKVAASEGRRVKKIPELDVVELVSAEQNNGVSGIMLDMEHPVSHNIRTIEMREDGSVFVLFNRPFEVYKKGIEPVMCYALKIDHNDPLALIKLNLINGAVNNSERDLSFKLSVIDTGETLTFALIDEIRSVGQQK